VSLGDLERYFGLLALGLARCLPLVWLLPAFGGPTVSRQLRLGFGGALSGLCLPILAAQMPVGGGFAGSLLVAREVLVGVVMGFVCACWFRAAEAAGSVVDVLCGFDFVAAGPSEKDGRRGPFAGVMLLFAIVVFLEIGGIGHVTLALARSYDAIPVAGSLSVTSAAHAAAAAVLVASAKLIEAALGLCAPVLVALVLADLVLGVIGRAIQQLPIHVLGNPLKTLLGIGVLLLGLGGIRAALQGSLADFVALMGWPIGPRP